MNRVYSNPENTIRFVLGGSLGRKYGRIWDMVCRTPSEGMRLIAMNCPGFKDFMRTQVNDGVDYHVKVDGREALTGEEMKMGVMEKVLILPVPQGAKSGGIFQVVLGAVLIVASFYTGGLATAGYMSAATAAQVGTAMMAVGFSMAISGIVSMLSPMPKLGDVSGGGDSLRSYYFNGAADSEGQGKPLAVIFGRVRVGGQTISAYVEAS